MFLLLYLHKISMTHIMIHFRIKELCKEKGILLRDLAESVEISRVSLTRIIQNQQNPTLLMLEKLAKALDVKVSELFGEPEGETTFACPKCGTKLKLVEYVEDEPAQEAADEKEATE